MGAKVNKSIDINLKCFWNWDYLFHRLVAAPLKSRNHKMLEGCMSY
jgi:hypothetical protein